MSCPQETLFEADSHNGENLQKEVVSSLGELIDLDLLRYEVDRLFSPEQVVKSDRFASAIETTPLVCRSLTGDPVRIYQKREDLRSTGSFKEQGAQWCGEQAVRQNPRRRVAVTWSAGNHGQGVSKFVKGLEQELITDGALRVDGSGHVLPEDHPNAPQTHVFCKATASPYKRNQLTAAGAEVHTSEHSEDYKTLADAAAAAIRFVESYNADKNNEYEAFVIPPYDHSDVIAGQANTLVSSVIQLRAQGVDTAAVPLYVYAAAGGIGLTGGMAVAMDLLICYGVLHPDSNVVAVQMEGCDSAIRGLRRLDASNTDMKGLFDNTIFDPSADGTAVEVPSLRNLILAQHLRDKGVLRFTHVTKAEVGREKVDSLEKDSVVKEPAGAMAGARIRRDAAYLMSHDCIVIDVVSGGNESSATAAEFKKAADSLPEAAGYVAMHSPTADYLIKPHDERREYLLNHGLLSRSVERVT